MLHAEQRLKKTKDIQSLLRRGRSVFHTFVTLKTQMHPGARSRSKVLFVVSTKVDKRSVYRNKLRRRAQAIVRRLSIVPGYYIAVFLKPEAKKASFVELTASIKDVFQNAKLLA